MGKTKTSSLKFIYSLILYLLLVEYSFALDTQVILKADTDISANDKELVTFGLPLTESDVSDIKTIKVSRGSTELAVFIEPKLRYHWSDNSIRSVVIQLRDVDMTGGDVVLRITDLGSSVPRVAKKPVLEGWTLAGVDKSNVPYPRIFAIHDTEYLSKSGIIPPFAPSTKGGDIFESYQLGQFNNWAGKLNYSKSTKGNWLFDRSSAMFKAYMSTGRVEFLKEAVMSKQFYFNYVRNDGSPIAAPGGDGCFEYAGVSCADGKYIAPQQAKLALALVGDDSQWDDSLIKEMALQADVGWNQNRTRDLFDQENKGFTERGAGLIGLANLVAWEMTADPLLKTHLNERIAVLKDMQQVVKPWEIAYGWLPKSGAWTHNMNRHEGNCRDDCLEGDANSRGFSPWMTENIIDFLWQTYWVTKHEDIPKMVSLAANAVELYGFTSSYDNKTSKFLPKPEFMAASASGRSHGCNTTPWTSELVYVASAYADAATRTSNNWWSWFSDNHNVEVVLILAAGHYFESNESAKLRYAARIRELIKSRVNSACSKSGASVPRVFNWQHRSNSVRTWTWVAKELGLESGVTSITAAVPPMAPVSFSVLVKSITDEKDSGTATTSTESPTGEGKLPGNTFVFVATKACTEGSSPNWQCSGAWTTFDQLHANSLVAVCKDSVINGIEGCQSAHRFIYSKNVKSTDGYFVCVGRVEEGGSRLDCSRGTHIN